MSSAMTSSRIRIAIVDDHPLFRAGLATSLRRTADLEIVMVGETAEDAVRAAASGSVDVLLLDITIPGGGIEAARSIVRAHPEVRILFLTGADSEDAAAETLAIGGRGYVLKGANGRELVKAIRTVHQGQLYVTPELATRMLARHGRREAPPPPERPAPAAARPFLSLREQQILDLAARGLKNREIAAELGLSVATVKHYISLVVRKWGVRNRVEAVVLHSRQPQEAALPSASERVKT
jgi:DNA-binding NarL/FixJ family response regulator